MGKHLVSVVMPIYNDWEYLGESIDSILAQTYVDWEMLLLVEHGCDQRCLDVISEFKDPRMLLFRNAERLGLPRSLNRGIALSHGDFIARMDSDDISLPTRLEKQVKLLVENREVGVCGTYAEVFGLQSWKYGNESTDAEVKVGLLLGCPIVHPSVMMRKSLIVEKGLYYNENISEAEDYELWSRTIWQTKIVNIPEILVKYRKHENNKTVYVDVGDRLVEHSVMAAMLKHAGMPEVSVEDINLHFEIFLGSGISVANSKRTILWCEMIERRNRARKEYDESVLIDRLNIIFIAACFHQNILRSVYCLLRSALFWRTSNKRKVQLFGKLIARILAKLRR